MLARNSPNAALAGIGRHHESVYAVHSVYFVTQRSDMSGVHAHVNPVTCGEITTNSIKHQLRTVLHNRWNKKEHKRIHDENASSLFKRVSGHASPIQMSLLGVPSVHLTACCSF
jgi:hypothetical protein